MQKSDELCSVGVSVCLVCFTSMQTFYFLSEMKKFQIEKINQELHQVYRQESKRVTSIDFRTKLSKIFFILCKSQIDGSKKCRM